MTWYKQDISHNKEIPVLPNNHKVNLDPAGYFLIRVANKRLEVGFCNNKHQMLYSFISSSAEDLAKTIAQQTPAISTEHALYLGRELAKAQIALEQHKEYVQD